MKCITDPFQQVMATPVRCVSNKPPELPRPGRCSPRGLHPSWRVHPGHQRWVCCCCATSNTSFVLLLGFHAKISTLTILCLMQPCSGTNGTRCKCNCHKQKREQKQAIFTPLPKTSCPVLPKYEETVILNSHSVQVCSPCHPAVEPVLQIKWRGAPVARQGLPSQGPTGIQQLTQITHKELNAWPRDPPLHLHDADDRAFISP